MDFDSVGPFNMTDLRKRKREQWVPLKKVTILVN